MQEHALVTEGESAVSYKANKDALLTMSAAALNLVSTSDCASRVAWSVPRVGGAAWLPF